MSPIKVNAKHPGEEMDRMSRINFAKVYNVEHNVKVYDFGDVHKNDRQTLKQQFKKVWDEEEGGGEFCPGQQHPYMIEEESEDDDEDEEDSSEEEDEEEAEGAG